MMSTDGQIYQDWIASAKGPPERGSPILLLCQERDDLLTEVI